MTRDDSLESIYRHSLEFLDRNPERIQLLNSLLMACNTLAELLPATIDKVLSQHAFPIHEMRLDLEVAIHQSNRGLYKASFSSLRSALELGLLSVYWDHDDNSHVNITDWVRSNQNTPFRKNIFKRLGTIENVRAYASRRPIFEELEALYEELSHFTHTRGIRYSGQKMAFSNVIRFNESVLSRFIEAAHLVVSKVVTVHVLKYPVAFQDTPMTSKFGLNGPVGGFIEPQEAQSLRELLSNEDVLVLQEISDADAGAISLAEWVNAREDITEVELEQQMNDHDKSMIEMIGFDQWLELEKKSFGSCESPRQFEKSSKEAYWSMLENWARENGFLISKREKEMKS